MAEIVNLRRARKARARTEAKAQANANRARHGVPMRERDLAKAQRVRLQNVTDAHRLKDPDA